MHEQYVGRLTPGMDVCDQDGHKIGTVARAYRDRLASAATAPGASATEVTEVRPTRAGVLEVKTGLLGLGHLYIPMDVIQDVTDTDVFLTQRKNEFASEWHRKPGYLDQLS